MEGYYKFPLKFDQIFQKRDLPRCALDESVARHIQLLIITSWGENKMDPEYGSFFWDNDFDILSTNSRRREIIMHSIQYAIAQYEKRLHKVRVEVDIKQTEIKDAQDGTRLRRRIDIVIHGILKKNNQNFKFQTGFFIGPFAIE
ncbi:MAG: GPW/gp25 family protein [Chitinophagaceae bacterium]|nr:GPW/gp25 family protein [Chitinophagaceae bacterium]